MNPDAPIVFNKAVLAKTIHKETDAGPGGPNHFRQSLLRDVRNQRLRLPGTTKINRLEENSGAANVQLNEDEVDQIEATLSEIQVQGDRYPAHLQARVGK